MAKCLTIRENEAWSLTRKDAIPVVEELVATGQLPSYGELEASTDEAAVA